MTLWQHQYSINVCWQNMKQIISKLIERCAENEIIFPDGDIEHNSKLRDDFIS